MATDTPRCGDYGGRSRTTGAPCQRAAGAATTHTGHGKCKSHGGNVPGAAAKSERALADAMAREWFGEAIKAVPVEDPLRALKMLAGECLAWKDTCSGFLRELSDVEYTSDVIGSQVRAQVLVWERALDRCEHVLTSLARLKIDERLARIEQDKADMVIRAMEAALKAAQVPAERVPLARRQFAAQLRVIDGAA